MVMDREAWRAAVDGVTKSWTQLSDWPELNWRMWKIVLTTAVIVVTQKSWCSIAGMVQVLCVHCFSSFRSLSKYYPFNEAFFHTPKISVHSSSVLFSSKIINYNSPNFQNYLQLSVDWQTIYITYYVFIVSGRNRRCKFCEDRDFKDGCLFCS